MYIEEEEEVEMEFPRLETERLILRQLTKQDADDLYKFLHDYEVMKDLGMEPCTSLEQIHDLIDWYDYSFQEQQTMRLGIEHRETGRIIGTCGIHSWEPHDERAEVVCVLDKQYWRQGIMSEALSAVIDYGFEELDLFRIQSKVEPQNTASKALMEKMGMRQEGLLRAYVFVFGEHRDNVMYSILRSEWEEMRRL